MKYWQVEGAGRAVGFLVKADTKDDAIGKIEEWIESRTDEEDCFYHYSRDLALIVPLDDFPMDGTKLYEVEA